MTWSFNGIKQKNIWHGIWIINSTMDSSIKETEKESKAAHCTCGGKFVGNSHSDWCDINNPPPETEELPF